ncbi:S8 family serine peptidase [Mycoplasma nasistruthionis]|uniref:S8 family serine peptidase n=1 Tax=Mycoplasma nasistruthionis TaxID=353852 RepID=UPI0013050B78|nr:S8 family serine peptidase [Mycoplasma nasistruthionis]
MVDIRSYFVDNVIQVGSIDASTRRSGFSYFDSEFHDKIPFISAFGNGYYKDRIHLKDQSEFNLLKPDQINEIQITQEDLQELYKFDGTSLASPMIAGSVSLLQTLTKSSIPLSAIQSLMSHTAKYATSKYWNWNTSELKWEEKNLDWMTSNHSKNWTGYGYLNFSRMLSIYKKYQTKVKQNISNTTGLFKLQNIVLDDYLNGKTVYQILDKYNTGISTDYKTFTASSRIYSIPQIIEFFEEKSEYHFGKEKSEYLFLAENMKKIFKDNNDRFMKNIFDLTADMTVRKLIYDREENDLREITNHKLKNSNSKDSSTEKIIYGSTSRNLETSTNLFMSFPQLEYMVIKIRKTDQIDKVNKEKLLNLLVEKYKDLLNNEFEIYCINELKAF